MASAAQFEANRQNAAASCGPTSPVGKAHSSRNHFKFGLFSSQNCVHPEEEREYKKLSRALWNSLHPAGAVQELLAVEIVRAAWRLHRCAAAEARDGDSPSTQASVDRARAAAHSSLRRLMNDLRQLQSDSWLRAEVLKEDFDPAPLGIADSHRVIKGLQDNERLKSLYIMSPIGIDPINSAPTIRTQSPPPLPKPVTPLPVAQASRPVLATTPAIPRNAPCPCHSGLKYKRCCGSAAPPVLG